MPNSPRRENAASILAVLPRDCSGQFDAEIRLSICAFFTLTAMRLAEGIEPYPNPRSFHEKFLPQSAWDAQHCNIGDGYLDCMQRNRSCGRPTHETSSPGADCQAGRPGGAAPIASETCAGQAGVAMVGTGIAGAQSAAAAARPARQAAEAQDCGDPDSVNRRQQLQPSPSRGLFFFGIPV